MPRRVILSNKTDKLEKYTVFNVMKHIVLAVFILTFVFIAIMDGFDLGEGEISAFSVVFHLISVSTWIDIYVWLGTIISIANYVLMWRFYPSDQYKDDHYGVIFKVINVLGVISVPAIWQFFISLWTLDDFNLLNLFFTDDLTMNSVKILLIILTFIPAFATGVMSVMGIIHKLPTNNLNI